MISSPNFMRAVAIVALALGLFLSLVAYGLL